MNGNKGFTIVEMLVVFAIFSIVIGIATGVFASMISLQRFNLANNHLLNQASYFVEYMSRAFRQAVKDNGSCILPSGQNYEVRDGGSTIEFKNYRGECQTFSLSGGRLMVSGDGFSGNQPLSSDDFTISYLNFNIIGEGPDNLQPRVTVSLKMTANNVGDTDPSINIQTTISQRNLDL